MGSVWEFMSHLLAPDGVVKLRTAARCWNVEVKYGPYGSLFLRVENGPVREALALRPT